MKIWGGGCNAGSYNESSYLQDMTKFLFTNIISILTGKPRGKRPLRRPRRRWEDNIRMDHEEKGINAGNWVNSAQDKDYWRALVNAAVNLRVL